MTAVQFSVVIPVYNKQKHIQTCLASVLAQTYPNFEILVINDGSTDTSAKEIQKIQDSRIRVFQTPNQGVSAARNLGIREAKNEFIAFLDADDYWYPNHLTDLAQLLTDFPGCGIYATNYIRKSSNQSHSTKFPTLDSNFRGVVPDFFEASFLDRIAWTSAVGLPKNLLEEIGGFDETLHPAMGEDLDLWIRIAIHKPVAFDRKVSAVHQLSAENRLSQKNSKEKKYPTLLGYEAAEKSNPSLQKFLNLYRSEFALKLKLASDDRWKLYANSLNPDHVSSKTKWLLGLPVSLLKALYAIKKVLEKLGFQPSAYH